jgi:cytosine deaminase
MSFRQSGDEGRHGASGLVYARASPLDYIHVVISSAMCIDRQMDEFMEEAVGEARKSLAQGGIPIGSVLVHDGEVIGRGYNRRVQKGSVVLHGEMDALENTGRRPASVYQECVLYTTLSPCAMCSGAIVLYGIPKIVVGENRNFMGEEEWLQSRGVIIEVQRDATCVGMLSRFIRENPMLWNEDIGKT